MFAWFSYKFPTALTHGKGIKAQKALASDLYIQYLLLINICCVFFRYQGMYFNGCFRDLLIQTITLVFICLFLEQLDSNNIQLNNFPLNTNVTKKTRNGSSHVEVFYKKVLLTHGKIFINKEV